MPDNLSKLKIPRHIAFIMDGNGRWAKKRMMPRTYGHKEGATALKNVIRALMELQVEYATFYAFSTENWNRPQDEVSELMRLFEEQLDNIRQYEKENVRIKFIGDRSKLPNEIQRKMSECEQASSERTGLTVIIAINYGGYDEIIRAVKQVSSLVKEGFIKTDDITNELFESFLDTRDIPAVDLMIRTGSEQRISNFLIWQIAYAELYFCDTLWPDFGKDELLEAVREYTKRDRRFGGLNQA